MRLYGFCNTCRKFRPIRVRSILMANHMPMGTCQQCDDREAEKRRGQK